MVIFNGPKTLFSQLTGEGFKSIRDRVKIELRPLTILAGANSSGKSSAMQLLLLLKQTFEASVDPGPLLINGPNVAFSSVDEMIWQAANRKQGDSFIVGLEWQYKNRDNVEGGEIEFHRTKGKKFQAFGVARSTWMEKDQKYAIKPGMSSDEIRLIYPTQLKLLVDTVGDASGPEERNVRFEVARTRSFLGLNLYVEKGGISISAPGPWNNFEDKILDIIHVPGLRGNPLRAYRVMPVENKFPGLFPEYLASVIIDWQETNSESLSQIGQDLCELGLTWTVTTQKLNDTQAEIRVGRLPSSKRGSSQDLVNIADVGFGVSQVLPVVVALVAASPGQMVYLEQPEMHLHPKAQVALARLLARAVQRGVQVVAETHSEMMLIGIQRLVAAGELDPAFIKLHWFSRDEVGATQVTSADLDENGAFGDWPVDFADVSMQIMDEYLDSVSAKYAQEPV